MTVEPASQHDLRVPETLVSLATLLLRRPASGLSLTASGALSLLTRLGPLRITDLAGRLHVSQPSMTELVIRLERSGLVARSRDRDDARAVLVDLTEEGRRLRDRVRRERAGYLSGLVAKLDDRDRTALVAAGPALDRLVELATESLVRDSSHEDAPEEMEEVTRG
ncbi:MAG: MarR family transcriptional regulator [Candidatus Dormibacteraeota bacterium]|nr:MarR family transcriptional regulator [Candidatus Dormibacteraeota bacterium]